MSDRVLAILLDITSEQGYVLGKDVGIISYNETPTKKYIKEGMSFPQARTEAFKTISNHENVDILKSPNAILEIAYRNAIHRLNSDIEPVPIPRVGDAYHEAAPKSSIASATAIRNLIYKNEDYSEFMPMECYDVLQNYLSNNHLAHFDMLYPYLQHTLSTSPETLHNVPDGNEELYNRMINAVSASSSMEEYIDNVKTKRFTAARVSRAVLHGILNISADFITDMRNELPLYARILGVNKNKKNIIGHLTKNAGIPVFTSVANPNLENKMQEAMLRLDIAATNLYNFTIGKPMLYNQDYTQKLTEY